jgi:hypothetical protein
MTSKFEQLIEYVINDEEAKAKELFHDIVVEKSREIYENLMSEEDEVEEGLIGGALGGYGAYKANRAMGGGVLGSLGAGLGGAIMGSNAQNALEKHSDSDEHSGSSAQANPNEAKIKDLLDQAMKLSQTGGASTAQSEMLKKVIAAMQAKQGGAGISEGMDDTSGNSSEDLMSEVETDESGMYEESDAEFDDEAEEDGKDMTHDMEHDHDEESEEGEEGLEDRVVDLEDKLDELMAEFEQLMGDEDHEGGEDEFDMEPNDDEVGGDAYTDDDTSKFHDMPMSENVSLAKVANPTHGDNGANAKSPVAANSGAAGMAAKPVRNTASEANPDGTSAYKAPTSYADKGRGNLPGAGSFKNVPAKNGSKLEAAPKPTLTQAAGTNSRTPFPKG